MNNEPVAWIVGTCPDDFMNVTQVLKEAEEEVEHWKQFGNNYKIFPLYTHPAKTLTDEDIAKVVHELNQKANTPERWVTAMEIGAETIIQLRDELAILRKAQK